MLVIGSTALARYKKGITPKDFDVVCFREDVDHLKMMFDAKYVKENNYVVALKAHAFNIECIIADDSPAMRAYLEYENAEGKGINYASLPTLYSIKKSHINFPIKFEKHIKDYCWLHSELHGVDKIAHITKLARKEVEKRVGKAKINLNKSVEEFFAGSEKFVKRFFNHDQIHKIMAITHRPMYERIQKNFSKVRCDKGLWEKLTLAEKVYCVQEEAFVIALERKIIPFIFENDKYCSAEEALKYALMRICTTLTSGYFREFATNNYFLILECANPLYDRKFLEAFDEGKIKLIKNLPDYTENPITDFLN